MFLGVLLTFNPSDAQAVSPAPWSGWIGGLAESADRLARGDAPAAEAAARASAEERPRGDAGRRARLALGLALAAEGRHDEAARALAGHDGPSAGVDAHVRLARAAALLAGGRSREALPVVEPLTRAASRPVAVRARRLRAEALTARHHPGSAAAWAEVLKDAPGDAGALLARAGSLRRAGDAAGAAAAYRELILSSPGAPAAVEAERALSELVERGRAEPLSAEEQLARAEKLILLALPAEAGALLASLDGQWPPGEPRTRAALLEAWTRLQRGDRAAAEALARRVLESPDAAEGTRIGAELVVARVAARSGRLADAIARYDMLSFRPPAAVPGLPPAAARGLAEEAAYLSAWLPFDAGAWTRAAEDLADYARSRPRSPRASDARWFEAWARYRMGDRDGAIAAFRQLEKTTLAPGALYWQARLASGGEARDLYRRALLAEPGGWYAFLAAARLSGDGEPASALTLPDARGEPPRPPAGAAEPLARTVALLALGLREPALEELRAVADGPGARAAAGAVAELAAAAGDPELTFRVARDQLGASRRTARWLHPLAYPELLQPAAHSVGFDPLLFLAVMRRESAFRTDARSSAGAEGLAQLLPRTAARLSSVLGVDRAPAPSLTAPAEAIPLGVAYLGLLQDRFAVPAAVLAAYNAGPGPAAQWARENERMPLDEWVEAISYRETRRYVKVVLTAWATYRALHTGGPALIDGSTAVPLPRDGIRF